MPSATLERLGLRRRGVFGLVMAPSSDMIRRVVHAVMPGGLEELPRVFRDKAQVVVVDGKCLRGARDAAGRAVMVLGAMPRDGALVAQRKVADKGSEITGFAALLAALNLEDAAVVADASHTQSDHARVLVEEFGAHRAFPVRRNQSELWKRCRGCPGTACGPCSVPRTLTREGPRRTRRTWGGYPSGVPGTGPVDSWRSSREVTPDHFRDINVTYAA